MIGVNDPAAVKRWSANLASMVQRSYLEEFAARGTLRLPSIGDCEVREELKHHGTMFAVMLTYRVNGGPTFGAAAATETHRWLPSENLRMRRELAREALACLRAQVRGHLDVVRPIDNGPEDRVAYSEALTRLKQAMDDRFISPERRARHYDDPRDAMRALAALPIPQSNE